MVTIAQLCSPPAGFQSPAGQVAIRPLADRTPDLAAFWANCPWSHWMLFVAGWHRVDLRPVIGACVGLIDDMEDRLPPGDTARSELAKLREWCAGDVPARDVDWVFDFPEDHVGNLVTGTHQIACAVNQLVQVAGRQHNLGPALPLVFSDVATWSARAVGSPYKPWIHQEPVVRRLAAGADHLRAALHPSVLAAAQAPIRMPSDWSHAPEQWPGLWESATP